MRSEQRIHDSKKVWQCRPEVFPAGCIVVRRRQRHAWPNLFHPCRINSSVESKISILCARLSAMTTELFYKNNGRLCHFVGHHKADCATQPCQIIFTILYKSRCLSSSSSGPNLSRGLKSRWYLLLGKATLFGEATLRRCSWSISSKPSIWSRSYNFGDRLVICPQEFRGQMGKSYRKICGTA